MKKSLAILLLSSASVFAGELPELFEKPWTAWYSGYEGKKFQFGVNPDGVASLIPLDKKSGDRSSQHSWIAIKPVVQEIFPDGKVVWKNTVEDGWEAITEESNEAEKVHFRGTVTGGARFEVLFEVDGDEVYASGQILDKGELTKNPIRMSFYVTIPNNYRHTKDAEDLEEKTKDDRFGFVMANKKKEKFKGDDTVEAAAKVCQEIKTIEADISYYDGPKIDLEAGDIGVFKIEKVSPDPIAQGFMVSWVPDPAKNEGGKGRMMLRFK